MPRVTCFQHIDCEGPGILFDVFKSKGVRMDILKPFLGEAVPDHLGDGLVVLGGPMGVYEEKKFPWMTEEMKAIQKCLTQSIPVLGVCLGSQMLARAAGGQVFRGAIPEVGWYPIVLNEQGRLDSLFLGLEREFQAFHWHGDTFTLPPTAARLASSGYYPNQIFRVGSNAYGFQCHLEVTGEMVRSWASLYAKELVPQGGPNRPERIEDQLETNVRALESIAGKVFARWAALL